MLQHTGPHEFVLAPAGTPDALNAEQMGAVVTPIVTRYQVELARELEALQTKFPPDQTLVTINVALDLAAAVLAGGLQVGRATCRPGSEQAFLELFAKKLAAANRLTTGQELG